MTKLVNRAKMTTATTGTGTITLGSAVDGYQTFADAGVADADVVRYVIEDGAAWEVGTGTYTATGTTLSRTLVESSTGSLLNLSGNAVVYVIAAAQDIQQPPAEGAFVDGDKTKLDGIETGADVTDAANVEPLVDTHLNTSTATTGEFLSWNGSDYDWVAVSGGATDINGLSDGYSDGSSVGLGPNALLNDDGTANRNTALGQNAGGLLTSGTNNVHIGAGADAQSATATQSVVIGSFAKATSQSISIGYGSMNDSDGSFNMGVGYQAAQNVSGSNNIGIGRNSLRGDGTAKLTGTNNTGIGYQTGYDLSTGAYNFLGGYQAGANLTTGSNNVAIGNGALDAATTGGRNIAIGQDAMGLGVATTASGDNVSLGYRAGYRITSGRVNVAIGSNALGTSATGENNIAIGESSMGNVASTGSNNVCVGTETGLVLSSGAYNVFSGWRAGRLVDTGSDNIALGRQALSNATTGGRNIAIGQDAMGLGVATSSAGDNIGIGYFANYRITSATSNIALGRSSLSNATTGGSNLAIGTFALTNNSTGANNVAIGQSAGQEALNSNNVFLGHQAGDATTTGSNQIVIGQGSDASSATVSNEITLGNSSITALRCQVTTITSLSDARDKTDIQPLNAGLEFVEALNPVSFTWNMRDGGKVGVADTGFIAQDLQMAQEWAGVTIPGLVYDVNPDKLEAGYGKLIPVLVQAIKDLSAKVNLLEAQLEAQK